MGPRFFLYCAMVALLTEHIAAQSMALTSSDPDSLIRNVLQRGYSVVRRDGNTVWVELPSNTAQAMQTAVRAAEADAAASVPPAGARGLAASPLWRKAQARKNAARPFQQAAFDELRAAGVASKFEPSNMYYLLDPTPAQGDIAAASAASSNAAATPAAGADPQTTPTLGTTAAVSPMAIRPSSTCTPTATEDFVDSTGEVVPYGLGMVGALSPAALALSQNMRNSPVMVCVIDTGMFASAFSTDLPPGLLGSMAPPVGASRTNQCPFNWDLGHFHGGHVMGTVAALGNGQSVRGVIPNGGNLRHCNVFGRNDGVDDPTILNGIGWCTQQRDALSQQLGTPARVVVSMSLGGFGISEAYNASLNRLADDNGLLLVAAAGNYGPNTINYPAAHPTCMSVGAVDRNNNTADFSSTNEHVDIAAAGVGVMSWYGPTSPSTYARVDLARSGRPTITIAAPLATSMFGTSRVRGRLVDCGLATTTCPRVRGSICLVNRGTNTFCQKAANCRAAGGVGMVLVDSANTCLPTPGLTLSGCTRTIPTVAVPTSSGATIRAAMTQTVTTTLNFSLRTNYAPLDGTSMATPHVSAAAAIVWASRPSCPASAVREALQSSATKPANQFPPGSGSRNNAVGWGIANIPAAITALAAASC